VKLAEGPRPWPIRLFAAAFVAQTLLSFGWELTHRSDVAAWLLEYGNLPLNDDGAIVAISVRLTIALIPVALVWFFASRFARWMVVVMALGRLAWNLPELSAALSSGGEATPTFFIAQVLALIGAALLFAPSASRWFAKAQVDARTFA
jgi:hypothetical protein